MLVIDSGNGGKYTLKLLQKKFPNENFIYFEDDLNCPYGKKSKHKLKKIIKKNIKTMLKYYRIKTIIFACNTISACCYNSMKKIFPFVPIIPISPNLNFRKKPALVMCTKATKKHSKDIKRIKKCSEVFVEGFDDLPKKIDENIENLSVLQHFFDKKLKKYAKMNIRDVSLGCTHFNFIKRQISNSLLFNSNLNQSYNYRFIKKINKSNTRVYKLNIPKIRFYESSNLVVKKLEKILKVSNLKNSKNRKGNTLFLKSSEFFLELK